MTCHPEKLDQVEVMGSERIQLRCNRGRRGQIHVAELAADHETGPSKLCGTPGAYQKGHVTACYQKPPAEIPADRAGADYENPHLQSLCKEVRY